MNARRWKQYPAYRDSGVEWLGEVPSHWEVRPLKRACSLNDEALAESTDPGLEIQYLDIGNVDSTGRINELQRMRFGAAPSRARRVVRAGDTVVSTVRTYLRAITHFESPPDDLIASTGFAVLRPTPTAVMPEFMAWASRSEPFIAAVIAHSEGVGYPAIAPTRLAALKLAVPAIGEQRAIAAFLGRETARIDALIAKKEELIRLLEEKRASLVTQVVTRGLSPDAPTVDSGIPAIGAVPAHWRVVRNKNILRAVQDPSPDGSEELLTVSHITGVTPRTEKDVTMFLAESNVGYPRVAPGDLVINTMWAWMGALGVARHHGIVSPAYGVYRFTDAGVLPDYYDAFYRTPAYVTEMTRFSTGVWSSRLRIYPDVFLSLRVVVPPIDEQRAILDHIKAATGDTDAVLDRLAASVALLREQRQALITAAVTGQIDVREDALA